MEKSSFFNSIGGDRKYNASEWAAYFASLVGNGVFGKPDNCLKVIQSFNVAVAVEPGSAWINGYYYVNTSRLSINLPTPDGILHHIDRIVLRWSLSDRSITVKVRTGTPSSKPAPPALQRDNSIYELALADVYVAAGSAIITTANITDLRGDSTLCGTVSSIVSEAHTHDIATQTKNGFMSADDKKKLDGLVNTETQDVSTTANVTFKTVTADKVIGAVYA